ncbi:MAG TPA: PEP/pyruvate-binding domain-containing protein [Planctomycetota bacterium]|nr:PEP/pyruvate-binding domain-containing protein [Planctomycetota bacterium]HRR81775.1 PEP/pyruvate-binding domain-containing protein [Planctomycetota bacterium]HRT95340.1 PEP/pyruvate-binding domain-containing protein [Planctomycetota bacterium]
MSQWIYFFGAGSSEGDPERKAILGGKGASLAAMSRAGLPVPPGFTLSAECCPIVEATGAWPAGLKEQVRAAMARLEEMMGRTFGRGPKPLLVAVRSGAAVSMPGMMDTILNVGLNPSLEGCVRDFWREYADHIRMFARSVAGLTLNLPRAANPREVTEEEAARQLLREYEQQAGKPFPTDPFDALDQAINAVFASWNSERAVTYRKHHDIRGVAGTAVNVQAMFPSERAGVLFTANPNAFKAGEMVLEASWGLGEAVVSGSVTPDIYIIDAASLATKREVPGHRPGNEPALTPAQVREIAEVGKAVEKYFGHPCDIEWGIAEGKVALLQSRAIRGLDILEDMEECRQEEIERLRELAAGERRVWVAHNLAETLAAPTPLTWDIIRHFMSGDGGFGLMYRDFGYQPSAEVRADGFLELICGRIYVDPRRAAGLFWDGMPLEYDAEAVAGDPGLLEQAPKKLNMQKAEPTFFLRLPKLVWAMIRSARLTRKARAAALDAFENQAVPRLRRYLDEAKGLDLTKLPTAELLAELRRRIAFVLDDFGKESLKPGFFGGMAQAGLLGLLTQLMGPERGGDLARQLTTGLDHDTTVEQNVLLYRVAQGRATMAEFLDRFGHRAVNEMELAQPRWREDSDYLERMKQSYTRPGVEPPEERHARQAAARRKAEEELPARLAEWGGASLYERLLPDLRDAQALLPYRETGKHYLMMGYETIRAALVELSRRWDLGRDLYFLHLDELDSFESRRAELAEAIAQRKLRWKSAQKLALSFVVDSERLDSLGHPQVQAGGARLEGCPLASGAAKGVARVVFDPQTAGDLGTGYILVCPSTDPGWTPLFVHARGLVVERGGVLSHGAIVARDFGIPAVVLESATQLIPDGATIEVDGGTGDIALLEAQADSKRG